MNISNLIIDYGCSFYAFCAIFVTVTFFVAGTIESESEPSKK